METYGGTRYGCDLSNKKQPHDMTFRMARVMGKNKKAAGRIRLRYLEQRINELLPARHPITALWINEMLEEVMFIHRNMHFESPPALPGHDTIDDGDIQAAKAYPINQLIDFTNGTAFAWCHDDARPSLAHLKRINKAKCYPCDKTFDPIDVLVERDGFNFIGAVKELR